MKRILIFSHIYSPYIGGAEIAIKEITDRIGSRDEHGARFIMITGWRNRKLTRVEQIENIKVYRVGFGFFQLDQYLYPFLAFIKALQLYRRPEFQPEAGMPLDDISGSNEISRQARDDKSKCGFDAVWAMMPSQAGMAALLFKLFKPGVPYLLTDQSGDSDFFWKLRTFFWKPIFKLIYKKADRLQIISNYLAERARKFGYKKSIDIIPNGVDIKRFSQTYNTEKKNQLRNKLKIKADEKIIISISRLVEKNGLETLIKSITLLCHSGAERSGAIEPQDSITPRHDVGGLQNDIKLLLIGSGNQENKLKTLVNKLKLNNQVLFLGNIPNKEISKYLAISDIFVRPSRSEGQGIAYLEAMTSGVPVIATPIGGIVDFIKDRETGLLAKVNNPQNLADKIELLLTDENLRNRLIINSKQLVKEKYDWDNISIKMKNLFNSLINN